MLAHKRHLWNTIIICVIKIYKTEAVHYQKSLEDFHVDDPQNISWVSSCQASYTPKNENWLRGTPGGVKKICNVANCSRIKNLWLVNFDGKIQKILPRACNLDLIICRYFKVALVHNLVKGKGETHSRTLKYIPYNTSRD